MLWATTWAFLSLICSILAFSLHTVVHGCRQLSLEYLNIVSIFCDFNLIYGHFAAMDFLDDNTPAKCTSDCICIILLWFLCLVLLSLGYNLWFRFCNLSQEFKSTFIASISCVCYLVRQTKYTDMHLSTSCSVFASIQHLHYNKNMHGNC